MPFIQKRVIKHVTHIGHLDGERRRPASFDAFGVAVSDQPEVWRGVAGLNGPEWLFSNTAAEWLDVHAFEREDIEGIEQWMLMKRYMVPVTAWAVDWEDPDTGVWCDGVFESRDEAAAKIGRSAAEEEKLDAEFASGTTAIETFRLEKRAVHRLGGWPDRLRWFDAAVILYAREVVLPKRPLFVGIWWDEPAHREAKTAPYGLIFPERIEAFTVEDEEGREMSFREAFPDFPIPKEENIIDAALRQLLDRSRQEEERLVQQGVDRLTAARLAARATFNQ